MRSRVVLKSEIRDSIHGTRYFFSFWKENITQKISGRLEAISGSRNSTESSDTSGNVMTN